METSSTVITLNLANVRDQFFSKYKENVQKGDYHPSDIKRLRDSTDWVKAFCKHGFDNMDKSVNLMNEVLKWRKEFGANDLLIPGKYPFPEHLFFKGALFKRNKDKKSQSLVHFVVKLHKKGQYSYSDVCKFIAFFLEREYKYNMDDPIVLILDMYDAGYSNMDMEMIKFVVDCLKTYYPGLLDYLIIFQMPFIFNTVWKIIKGWLPPETVKLVKFCDKKSIREFVNEDQLLSHMGGTDNYVYKYEPGMFEVKDGNEEDGEEDNVSVIIKNPTNDLNDKFQSSVNLSSESNGFINKNNSSSQIIDDEPTLNKTENKGSPPSIKFNESVETNNNQDATELSFSGSALTTPLLSITPGDELLFDVSKAKSDILQNIKLTNTSGLPLAYKIKITSPDKFRVKPGMGIIQTSSCAQIGINFLKEYHRSGTVSRDKFLILWTPITDTTMPNDINDFWKMVVQKKISVNEHKIKCSVKNDDLKEDRKNNSMSGGLTVSQSMNTFVKNNNNNNNNFNSTAIKLNKINQNNDFKSTKSLHTLKMSSKQETSDSSDELTMNQLSTRLAHLELNTNLLVKSNSKLLKQYYLLLYLVYFLILLNFIQIIFQSNLFTQVIEPYIDYFFFQKKD